MPVAELVSANPQLWSQSQLAVEFQLDRRTVKRRLAEGRVIAQGNTARGFPGYYMTDAAPALLQVALEQADPLDPDRMSPKERKDWFDGEHRKRQLQIQDRELIPVTQHEEALAHYARQVIMTLDTLPDLLEKDAGIDGRAVERCQRVIDGIRELLAERVADVPA